MENNDQANTPKPEVWMRGPIEGVPSLLQPVAHTLLQAVEEIQRLMEGFPVSLLWEKPAGMASAAFHLQHIPGVIDRLFTYSKGEQLSIQQMKYLSEEGLQLEGITTQTLVKKVEEQVSVAISYLKQVDETSLSETRYVGRKKLPSTVIGLLFHAAEHTMRHFGQLLVTVNVVKDLKSH